MSSIDRDPDSVHHHHHFIHHDAPNAGPDYGPGPAPPAGGGLPPTRNGFGAGGGRLEVPSWFSSVLAALAILVLIALIVMGLIALAHALFDSDHHSAAKGATIVDILHSKHFATDHHALCGIGLANNATAYRLTLNRGGSCRYTVDAVLPVEEVQLVHSRHIRQQNATFVFNPRTYSPADVQRIKRLPMGKELKVDLRFVVVRLTSTDFKHLRAQPAS